MKPNIYTFKTYLQFVIYNKSVSQADMYSEVTITENIEFYKKQNKLQTRQGPMITTNILLRTAMMVQLHYSKSTKRTKTGLCVSVSK